MRNSKFFSVLVCSALLAAGCAGPSAVGTHWGEAQRGAGQAMVESARNQPERGIDGEGASAAYDNYSDALRAEPEQTRQVLLDIVEDD
jgi:hypothetical protein